MKNTIDLNAAIECTAVYQRHETIQTPWYNVFGKTTQYGVATRGNVTYLNICGTNELMDWPSNALLASWKGIKLGAYWEAKRIYQAVGRPPGPLCVTGHSRGAPSAIAYGIMYGVDYCRAFSPARSLRPWANLVMPFDCKLFIDPDDLVPKMGAANFRHPECHTVYAENDKLLPSVGDHAMGRWIDFLLKEE